MFLWCILAHLHTADDHKKEPQNMLCICPPLCVEELEIPVKVKDIPKLERMKNLNINVFQVNKTVPSPVYRAKITYNHK